MDERSASANDIVTMLLPSLSRSLEDQFNVFRVMHHGTHEKQISNVFAWLLDADANHELGDAAQRVLLHRINAALPHVNRLPSSGYRVAQEVVTHGLEDAISDTGADIADIVLSRADAAVVVENFGTSDGHGHDYHRYLAHGTTGGRAAVVVLLCQRRESHRQRDGWESAVVVTYAEVLRDLQNVVDVDGSWRMRHPNQHFFIRQMLQHFVEGPAAVNLDDTISFLTTMCDTGESERFGHRPRDAATQQFADLVAEHARSQLEVGRAALASAKSGLRAYSRSVLMDQVNATITEGRIEQIVTRFVGRWEWCVELQRADAHPTIFLEFGPTAVVEQQRVPLPVENPDYSRVFISIQDADRSGIARIAQTDVHLAETISGLAGDDFRLRDAVLRMVAAE